MKRLYALLACIGAMFPVLVMLPGIAKAQTNAITLSCVFQGAGELQRTITVDLQRKQVTDGYSGYKVYPLKEVTDSVVRWHEVDSNISSDNELDRGTGNLTRQMVQGGQAFIWTYACQRIQKQF
jgi:hypothetical protein